MGAPAVADLLSLAEPPLVAVVVRGILALPLSLQFIDEARGREQGSPVESARRARMTGYRGGISAPSP